MPPANGPTRARNLGLRLALLGLLAMGGVSLLVALTQAGLDRIDRLLLWGAPFVFAGLGYLVGRRHDPNASD